MPHLEDTEPQAKEHGLLMDVEVATFEHETAGDLEDEEVVPEDTIPSRSPEQ